MNTAIAGRLADVIGLCERLKAAVEGERPGALLLMFTMMRAGIDVNAMVATLQGHLERLIPQSAGSSEN
jgi:hypothetical protein